MSEVNTLATVCEEKVDWESDSKVKECLKPFFKSVGQLQETVEGHFLHWLDETVGKPTHDDSCLKEKYLRINSLITEELLPELCEGIKTSNVKRLGRVAAKLLEYNVKEGYQIDLGTSMPTAMMEIKITNKLGKVCAENLGEVVEEVDIDNLIRTIVKALTNVVDRMTIYIDPNR